MTLTEAKIFFDNMEMCLCITKGGEVYVIRGYETEIRKVKKGSLWNKHEVEEEVITKVNTHRAKNFIPGKDIYYESWFTIDGSSLFLEIAVSCIQKDRARYLKIKEELGKLSIKIMKESELSELSKEPVGTLL